MINLEAVASLRAVQLEGSVVSAASALGFTPSGVSQQIKRLERQAGVALLERVGRGVILTQAGRQLVEEGSRLLGEVEAIESALHRESGTVAGTIRLVAFATAVRGLVAPALPLLLTGHPDLHVRLLERDPWDAIDLVASGQSDVGVVHSWGDVPLAIPEHVEQIDLAEDVADVVMHRDHPRATQSILSPRDLIDETWIATPDGTICREWLTRMHDGTGGRPNIVHQSTEFESHIALVAAGLGVALVPRLGRSLLPDTVVAVAVHDPVPHREISFIVRRTMNNSPSVSAILSVLQDTVTKAQA
ncbi:MAG: LysR family transcriptional regulator [Acidimicrobiales bacterium]